MKFVFRISGVMKLEILGEDSTTLAVEVRLLLIRIEYVFAFQIWYYQLFVKKNNDREVESIISIFFFLAFSQLNIS